MVPRLGPVRLRRLLNIFGEPQRVLSASLRELKNVEGVGGEVAESVHKWESHVDLPAELQRIKDFGASVVTEEDSSYPKLLREIHDPPIVLYVWGKLDDRDHQAIGVVGSRKTTMYGLDCAKKLSYQLAYAGLTVVSGLARGIDTAAHQGALAAKGRTIAVIGSGLNHLYPPENQDLAEKIVSQGCAVVSEFSMDVEPDRQTFPMRNRVVSGWSFGMLVVEAALNSGALISANFAAEQNRTIYAVPGPIDRPTSHGSNRLIQQGAKLVMDSRDILEDLELLLPRASYAPDKLAAAKPVVPLKPEEEAVYQAIGQEETSIDQIISTSGLTAGGVSVALLSLELKRLVKQLPGKYFVKIL